MPAVGLGALAAFAAGRSSPAPPSPQSEVTCALFCQGPRVQHVALPALALLWLPSASAQTDCVGAWDVNPADCTTACETRTYTVTTAASGGGSDCDANDGTTAECQPGEVRFHSRPLWLLLLTRVMRCATRERASRHRATASRAPPSPPSLLLELALL